MSTRELRLGRNEIDHFLTFLKDQPRDLIGILTKPKAILNFFLVEFQHRLLKTSTVAGLPYHLTIETGNFCPLCCSLCPTGQEKEPTLERLDGSTFWQKQILILALFGVNFAPKPKETAKKPNKPATKTTPITHDYSQRFVFANKNW